MASELRFEKFNASRTNFYPRLKGKVKGEVKAVELKNTTVDILLNRLEITYEIIKNSTIKVK